MSLASFQVEGQDQTPQELLVSNSRQVIQDVLQHMENNETCGNIIDYATYKIDHRCPTLTTRSIYYLVREFNGEKS